MNNIKLEDRISKMSLLYRSSRESFELFKYFCEYYKNNDNFYTALWVKIMELAIKDTVIGLMKFYSGSCNDNFNLCIFFKELDDISENNNKITINEWRKKKEQFKPQIKILKDLRDKNFAHTDIESILVKDNLNQLSIDYRRFINVEQIEKLFDFIKEVLSFVNKYLNAKFDSKLTINYKNINILEKLSIIKQNEKNEFNKVIKQLIADYKTNK